jgi:hypothetical protein
MFTNEIHTKTAKRSGFGSPKKSGAYLHTITYAAIIGKIISEIHLCRVENTLPVFIAEFNCIYTILFISTRKNHARF